jgi:predicted ATPase
VIALKSVTLRELPEGETGFPFNLPIVRSLGTLDFTSPVTFFVGENGSGKSTLMEALACAVGAITIGSESVRTDPTLAELRRLAMYLRLSWQKRTHKGFFLRAEDFFGYARSLSKMRAELAQDLKAVDEEYKDRSPYAADLARSAYAGQLGALKQRYGDGLEVHSNGESFLALFQARFVPGGLYLLDEPEAPLSPIRQLSFLSALKAMVAQESQFLIATHSPILLAFPGAAILSFDGARIQPMEYEALEHVRVTRDFLDHPDAYLRHL